MNQMSIALQHVKVLLIVAACVAVVAGQGLRTFRGKRSKLGACCAKGCDAGEASKPQDASRRIVFLPAEMLTSSAHRSRPAPGNDRASN